MKNVKTLGIQFVIKSSKVNKRGLSPLVARVTVNGKRIEISANKVISRPEWDFGKGRVKGINPESRFANRYQDYMRSRILECYQELFIEKRILPLKQ
ncbi:hypothetical protein IFO69_01205 [Echinicola sp. CAU 1574]|uniref:Arm DNA-binding domain-containing protein n=1 Tax=Echinicola arenosa TaxID=2774144 RepID=A0ABR9AHD2_9BACT|nr:Arm DNA-binding domain-containing protein [Echinicola arenosa]MBD8487355.1 hypothetical protein [Echinicola arenosa]